MDLTATRRDLEAASLDPHEFFGDEPDATYRGLAKELHPDRYPNDPVMQAEATSLFTKLGELQSRLSGPCETIASPKREYSVRSALGKGDLCDILFAKSGAERFVIKRPFVTAEAANNLLAKEREVLEQLIEASTDGHFAKYVPHPVETFTIGKQRLCAYQYEDGFTVADEIMRRVGPLDGRHVAWMLRRLLTALGYSHQTGWVHGAPVPAHLLFSPANHGLCLIGWLHAVKFGKPLSCVPATSKAWYPAEAKTEATPATDIYLAAKTAIRLSGGDPLTNESPLPAKFQAFLKGCLLESPRMRPSDAWRVHDELAEVLESVYGPPKFVELCLEK